MVVKCGLKVPSIGITVIDGTFNSHRTAIIDSFSSANPGMPNCYPD